MTLPAGTDHLGPQSHLDVRGRADAVDEVLRHAFLQLSAAVLGEVGLTVAIGWSDRTILPEGGTALRIAFLAAIPCAVALGGLVVWAVQQLSPDAPRA